MSGNKRKLSNYSKTEDHHVSQRKRLKKSPNRKIISNVEESELHVLEEMGISMLDSDESTSSASSISIKNNMNNNAINGQQDENHNNKQTPLPSVPARHHLLHDDNNMNLNNKCFDSSSTETSFIDPNQLQKSLPHKTSSSNIEIYNDNKSGPDRNHKKLTTNNNVYIKSRSPLATVTCNNNFKNVKQHLPIVPAVSTIPTPTTSTILPASIVSSPPQPEDPECLQQLPYVSNDKFYLFRHNDIRNKRYKGNDKFQSLSDEMLLQVFKWLPKKALIRCRFVCKRFNQLTQDESLWTRLDLSGKSLISGALEQVVSHGVVILRLAQTQLSHPVFDPDGYQMCPDYRTKLQYLDLSMATITKSSLQMLLSKCRNLKKLSLEHVALNDEICDEIAKNTQLEALNLAMCEGINRFSIEKMIQELQKLHSLNISWTFLDIDAISSIMRYITPNLLRLNIAGCRKNMFDIHVQVLTMRCLSLLELDLSDCTGLTSEAVSYVCTLKDLEYLSLSRCYGISASSYTNLSNLPSLAFLDVFGILSDLSLQTLQSTFPALGINKFIHSSVARPTVGTRRTSIWGLRTRD